jgi:DNA-binding transcriptional LysR family regulator
MSIEDLARLPLIVTPVGSPTRTLLDDAFAEAGLAPRIAVEATARERTLPFVLAGVGAALYPTTLAARAHMSGAVVRIPEPRLRWEIGVVHRDRRLSPAAQAFADGLEPGLEDIRTRLRVEDDAISRRGRRGFGARAAAYAAGLMASLSGALEGGVLVPIG